MARKPAKLENGYRVEAAVNGQWLWVILPNFETAEAAQVWIDAKMSHDRTPTQYRITPALRG